MEKIKTGFCLILMAVTIGTGCLVSCNKQLIDTVYNYNYAIIKQADGSIVSGTVQNWKDYEDGEYQVKIDDIYYLVHISNLTLMKK
jgi:hypothetical protein